MARRTAIPTTANTIVFEGRDGATVVSVLVGVTVSFTGVVVVTVGIFVAAFASSIVVFAAVMASGNWAEL